ncbi:ABC transporter ATP-binding protein [Evansella clarkii]|uniref:ATP-binding cassette domain-containing protein n=1 Tax=Evansella clarkii TaxID=79879 RepID=UPI0009960F6C|nr:ABC transporter ATP-binding protein [Evansella clarkii]
MKNLIEIYNQFKDVINRKAFLLFLLQFTLKVIFLLFTLIPAFIVMYIFDTILPTFDKGTLTNTLLFLLLFLVLFAILEYFLAKVQLKTNIFLKQKTQKQVVNSILNKDYMSIKKFGEGDLIYRTKQDLEMIIQRGLYLFLEIPLNFFLVLALCIIMFYFNPFLATIAFLLIFSESIYSFFFSKTYESKVQKVKILESKTMESLKQLMDRLLFIKLNNLSSYEERSYMNVYEDALGKGESLSLYQAKHKAIIGIMANSKQLVIIAVGAYLISINQTTIGVLLAFTQIMFRTAQPLDSLYFVPFIYKDMTTSFQRIKPLLERDERYGIREYTNDSDPDIIISCRNLTYSVDGKLIIKDFNIDVERGERVAIIGQSGSGKSTLCKLIAGLFNYQGTITIRSNTEPSIGFLIDECSLLRGTVVENLTYGTENIPITNTDIKEVLKEVKLEHFIDNASIIDKTKISRGEQQRLELARIMLTKPDIIILDEPTSALDTDTEKVVWSNFLNRTVDSTIIYTTHKKSIIGYNDRIVNLQSRNTSIENQIAN